MKTICHARTFQNCDGKLDQWVVVVWWMSPATKGEIVIQSRRISSPFNIRYKQCQPVWCVKGRFVGHSFEFSTRPLLPHSPSNWPTFLLKFREPIYKIKIWVYYTKRTNFQKRPGKKGPRNWFFFLTRSATTEYCTSTGQVSLRLKMMIDHCCVWNCGEQKKKGEENRKQLSNLYDIWSISLTQNSFPFFSSRFSIAIKNLIFKMNIDFVNDRKTNWDSSQLSIMKMSDNLET